MFKKDTGQITVLVFNLLQNAEHIRNANGEEKKKTPLLKMLLRKCRPNEVKSCTCKRSAATNKTKRLKTRFSGVCPPCTTARSH